MNTVNSKSGMEIETGPGDAIVIERSSKLNRIRDIGLWLVVVLLGGILFLTWRDSVSQTKFEEKRNEMQDTMIRTNKETIDNLSKLIKSDMANEHQRTRDMLLRELKKLSEQLDKDKKK